MSVKQLPLLLSYIQNPPPCSAEHLTFKNPSVLCSLSLSMPIGVKTQNAFAAFESVKNTRIYTDPGQLDGGVVSLQSG